MRLFVVYCLSLFVLAYARGGDIGQKALANLTLPVGQQLLHDDPGSSLGLKCLRFSLVMLPDNEQIMLLVARARRGMAVERSDMEVTKAEAAELLKTYAAMLLKKHFRSNAEAGEVARLYYLMAKELEPAEAEVIDALAYLQAYGCVRSLDDMLKRPPDFDKATGPGEKPRLQSAPVDNKDKALAESALQCAHRLLAKDPVSMQGMVLLQLGLRLAPGDYTGHVLLMRMTNGIALDQPKRMMSLRVVVDGMIARAKVLMEGAPKPSWDRHLSDLYLAAASRCMPDHPRVQLAVSRRKDSTEIPPFEDLVEKSHQDVAQDMIVADLRIDEAIKDVFSDNEKDSMSIAKLRAELVQFNLNKKGTKYPKIYELRDPAVRKKRKDAPEMAADEQRVVNQALKWLSSRQQKNGCITNPEVDKKHKRHSVAKNNGVYGAGKTGVALMAFLANNQLPNSKEYGFVVTKSLLYLADFVMTTKAEDLVDVINGPELYSRAAIALIEGYAMTRLEFCKKAATMATAMILAGQNADGGFSVAHKRGGWEARATAWCLFALQNAKGAGIDRPGLDEAIDKGLKLAEETIFGDNEFYLADYAEQGSVRAGCYLAPILAFAGKPDSKALTDELRNHLIMRTGRLLDQVGRRRDGIQYFDWREYSAILASRHLGGAAWRDNRSKIATDLSGIQNSDGSWSGLATKREFVPDVRTTAFAALCIQVGYQYQLPPVKVK